MYFKCFQYVLQKIAQELGTCGKMNFISKGFFVAGDLHHNSSCSACSKEPMVSSSHDWSRGIHDQIWYILSIPYSSPVDCWGTKLWVVSICLILCVVVPPGAAQGVCCPEDQPWTTSSWKHHPMLHVLVEWGCMSGLGLQLPWLGMALWAS